MRVTFWGTRGSIASAGPETVRYGGNTACLEVRGRAGSVVVLDAGTGIRRLGAGLADARRVDVFLTHLHVDHIQGLGFFAPLFWPEVEVHIWGPPSPHADLATRLNRYLSPPLFPVRLKELGSRVTLHNAPADPVTVGGIEVVAELIIHPGPTVGYRLTEGGRTLAYLPDHEPALGARDFPDSPAWTSGYSLAHEADLLVHDAQYTDEERAARIGWGHSSLREAVAFAELARVSTVIPFHHDPAHDDDSLDQFFHSLRSPAVEVRPSVEGMSMEV